MISIKIPRQVFVDRSEQNAKEDAIKLENEAIIENKKAAADPRYIKQSERRKARLQKEVQDQDVKSDPRNYDPVPGFGSAFIKFENEESCRQACRAL